MNVAVIGLGAFGRWFVEQYLKQGFKVKVYDVDSRKIDELRLLKVIGCSSIKEVVENVEYVVVAVPINAVCQVVEEASKYMDSGTIIDISSLKKPVYDILKNLPERLNTVCIHPLFGPRTPTLENQKIAFIPVRNSSDERKIIEILMPGARIVETTVEEHDKAMTYILSLTHLLSLIVVKILKSIKDQKSLKELAGSSFKNLCKMLDSTLTESLDTFTSILFYNTGTKELSTELLNQINELDNLLSLQNYDKLKEFIKKGLETYCGLSFIKEILMESDQPGEF